MMCNTCLDNAQALHMLGKLDHMVYCEKCAERNGIKNEEKQVNTCKTCYWFDKDSCFYSPPPWNRPIDSFAPDVIQPAHCSKWKTKLDAKCINCKFFDFKNCQCRYDPPNLHNSWPSCYPEQCCGKFEGKE